MSDGPDGVPRRSRRTRTGEPPASDGGATTGSDDVLDRLGLRDRAVPRDDDGSRGDRDDEPSWPPRARRRASAPATDDDVWPPDDGARRPVNGTRRTRRGAGGPEGGDGPGDADRPAGDGPSAGGRAPRRRARNGAPARSDARSGPAPDRSGREAPDGRRRRGAADSRHTEVMPVAPRRRARRDDTSVDGPDHPATPDSPGAAPGPPGAVPPAREADDPSRASGRIPREAGTPVAPPGPGTPAGPGTPPAARRTTAPGAPPAARPASTPARPADPDGAAAPDGPVAATGPASPAVPATARRAAAPPSAPPPAPLPAPPSAPVEPDDGSVPDDPADRAAPDDEPPRPGGGARRPAEPDDAPPDPAPAGPVRRVLRVGVALLALVVFVACASGFSSRGTVEDGIRTVEALDPESDAISSRTVQAADENVLVLGLPSDRGRVPEAARGDTAVLVHLPAGGAPALTLGFPANLEVARPPCARWDPATGAYGDTVPAESRTAFSAAYDVGGPKCAVGVVQQVTGLVVTRFVALDLAGLDPLVDAVRGVGVCTERPVVDPALGPVVTRAGETVLGGSEATRFAAATGVDDTSPANRVQRQQRVLAGVLDSALSTSSLLTPGASERVARALPGAVTVDGAGAGELLVLSRSLSRPPGSSADAAPTYVTVPVSAQPNTRGHLELRRSESSELFSALREHEPLPEDVMAPAQRAATTALSPGTVVDVLNAAGRPGLAGEIADALRVQGYAIGAVRDAPPTPDSALRFSPDRSEAAGVLAASVQGARPEAAPDTEGTLELVLGTSFPGPTAITPPAQPAGPTADCG